MSLTARLPVLALLCVLTLAHAPQALARRGGEQPLGPGGTPGAAYEIDRRSHPALAASWSSFIAGGAVSDAYDENRGLAGATILHAESDWALVWLDQTTADRLREQGVRLSEPRPRPAAEPVLFPIEKISTRQLSLWQSLAAAVNQEEMMAHLDQIATVIQTRYYNTTGMQAATQYVYDRFVEYGLDNVYFNTFTYNGYSIRNVVGVKTGTVYPSRFYMICGHLDSTSQTPATLAPGAEDNGSGSVGVLEAARLLGRLQTDATIYFVCFTAEEQGLIGSAHLANIAQQENWDLRGVLNMDMVGFDLAGQPDLWLEGFYNNPASIALMDLLENVANTYTNMGVYRYPANGWGSDHVSFHNRGFPAILAIDYNWDSYPCYHRTCDVVANIVPSHLRRMVLTVTVAGAQLSGLQSALGHVEGIADRTDSPDDAGITVEVAGTGYTAAVSGPEGGFGLVDLLPGQYTLRASAAGYATAEVPITVVAGQTTPVTILLDPLVAAVVHGRVSLGSGEPLTGALVFVTGQQVADETAPDGTYTLEQVYPGDVAVNANRQGLNPVGRLITVPSGDEIFGVNFVLKPVWDFETANDGLSANLGWAWGTDAVSGARSGTKVWGTRLGANYDNCADYRLDIPPIDLRFYQNARLRFWHWFRTESTYDGGNIQVSTDAGATWSVLTPLGGYNNQLRGSCNPLAGQPGFGGTGTTWREVTVDLGAYIGQSIRLRFWFGSDSGTRERGWYIDDVLIEGTMVPMDVAEDQSAGAAILTGLSTDPNPAVHATKIRFRLGQDAATWIAIFDSSGRRVRSMARDAALPAGAHAFTWDGADDEGRKVAAGVYWVRVFAEGRTVQGRLTLLR